MTRIISLDFLFQANVSFFFQSLQGGRLGLDDSVSLAHPDIWLSVGNKTTKTWIDVNMNTTACSYPEYPVWLGRICPGKRRVLVIERKRGSAEEAPIPTT